MHSDNSSIRAGESKKQALVSTVAASPSRVRPWTGLAGFNPRLINIAVTIALLHFAQGILIPVALATLLSFLLTPLTKRFERLGLRRVAGVILSVCLSFGVTFLIGWVIVNQTISLSEKLPEYRANIHDKIRSIQGPLGQFVSKLSENADQISRDMNVTAPHPETRQAGSGEKPVPVQVVEPRLSALDVISGTVGPLLGPLATLGVILLLTIFILVNREDLRNRFIRLIAHGHLSRTTEALDDASSRVSRYLSTQLLINAGYGLCIAIGLWAIGVPNYALWGMVSAIAKFVPYVGTWASALVPVALSFVVISGWQGPLLTIGLFVFVETITANLVEPLLLSTSTGLTPIAIVGAAIFWAWLWGAVGLLISTPLTVCLVVLGRYVPQLEFLYILLSSDQVLTPAQQLYQRLLAYDYDEASEIVEEYLKGHSVLETYDSVLSPVLVACAHDFALGAVDQRARDYMVMRLREIAEDLITREPLISSAEKLIDLSAPKIHDQIGKGPVVACIPSRDVADEIEAAVLAQVMVKLGYTAEFLPVKLLAAETLQRVADNRVNFACIAALSSQGLAHVRYLTKRVRSRFPQIHILVCVSGSVSDFETFSERLRTAGADRVVNSLSDALADLRGRSGSLTDAQQPPAALQAAES